MKLMIVLGTRPEIIRLSRIITEAPKYFEFSLVHTGQNWDKNLSDIFFKQFNLQIPNHYLDVSGSNLGETMGNIISKSYKLFSEVQPDCILILGDTNSALSAISAKRLKIPIFHMEAGNRCFDQNVPEEINRKIVDHISDVNLCYTENSRRYLLSEGARKDLTFVTGSPLTEVLNYYRKQIDSCDALATYSLTKGDYFVLSLHREENVDDNIKFKNLISTVNTIAEKYRKRIIFSTHPRTKKKIIQNNIVLNGLVESVEPLSFFDYCNLQVNSYCVLSDSGSLMEESSVLNFPAVSIRDSTERPEAIDKGNIVLGNMAEANILSSINLVVGTHSKRPPPIPYDYMDNNVSTKVLKVIQSYTPIVNKVVWFKRDID